MGDTSGHGGPSATRPELRERGRCGRARKSRLMTASAGLLGKPVPELLNPEEGEDLEIKDAPPAMHIGHFVVSPLRAPETLRVQ